MDNFLSAYRCCYCFYWNPARKQRPVAPKLTNQPQKQSSTESTSEGNVKSNRKLEKRKIHSDAAAARLGRLLIEFSLLPLGCFCFWSHLRAVCWSSWIQVGCANAPLPSTSCKILQSHKLHMWRWLARCHLARFSDSLWSFLSTLVLAVLPRDKTARGVIEQSPVQALTWPVVA